LVVVSSIAAYGSRIQTETCNEQTGHGPWQGAYGRAKQGQETVALQFAEAYDLLLTIIRPANVYGLGGASAWGDRLLEAIRATGGGVIGDAERNQAGLVYVENLADAILLATTRQEAIGRIYNVCDENGVTWRRFMDDMAHLAGCPPPPCYPLAPVLQMAGCNEDPATLVPPRDPSVPSLEAMNLIGFDNRFDSARIRGELGWSPRYSYEQALAEMQVSCRAE
jgi:nucleoside-diphosphate-sugar epimerase